MMAAAIVCAAVATQAATVDWTVSWSEGSGIYADASGNMCDASAPVYLILSSEIGQESLVNGFLAGTADVASYALAQGAMDGYMISAQALAALGGRTVADQDAVYFAIVNGKNLYVSADSALFYDDNAHDYSAPFDEYGASFSAPLNAYAGNSAWYTAVPEPTSGLLLLLGVAGLALRRRRA